MLLQGGEYSCGIGLLQDYKHSWVGMDEVDMVERVAGYRDCTLEGLDSVR